jgi:hypothetical protein
MEFLHPIHVGPDAGGEPRVLAALPRKTQAGTHCKLFADAFDLIPASQLSAFYGVILKHLATWRLDQDGIGSCAAEATANCLMLCRAIGGLPHVLCNPWTVYQRVTNTDSGSDIGEDFEAAKQFGFVPMSLWDRSQHSWRSAPPATAQEAAKSYTIDETWDITNRAEFSTAVALGFPVAFGVWWSGGGGHAVTAIGFDSDGVDYLGSWGPAAHENGDGTGKLPWRQVERGLDTFTARACRSVKISGPAPAGMGH